MEVISRRYRPRSHIQKGQAIRIAGQAAHKKMWNGRAERSNGQVMKLLSPTGLL